MPDGFWRYGCGRAIARSQRRPTAQMTGYSRQRALAHACILTWRRLENARGHGRPYAQGCRRPVSIAFESRHRKKDGGILDVEISVSFWRATGQFLLFAPRHQPSASAPRRWSRSSTRRWRASSTAARVRSLRWTPAIAILPLTRATPQQCERSTESRSNAASACLITSPSRQIESRPRPISTAC